MMRLTTMLYVMQSAHSSTQTDCIGIRDAVDYWLAALLKEGDDGNQIGRYL